MLPADSTTKSHLEATEPLAGWINERVDAWRTWRDVNYASRWEEYYRMYRGLWTEADKTRNAERSRIMGTELAQAVETSCAEIEDAIFARERWIDIVEDVDEKERMDMARALNVLLEEYDIYNVKGAISEIILNGALYGTGIGKIVIDRVDTPYVDNSMGLPAAALKKEYCVKLISISPRNFIIDPNATDVNDALGCAHETKVPVSVIQKRINDGIYKSFPVQPYEEQVENLSAMAEFAPATSTAMACKVVEWHGLVPKSLISEREQLFDDLENALVQDNADKVISAPAGSSTEDMVEAIVTVVNDDYIARAVINPFIFQDRSIVAFPFDVVPNRFWGRGVCEKGYNPQKALDAELRARIDALGFSTAPMMGMDSTKIPRGEKFGVKPGKTILTIGNPADSLMPIQFPPPDPYTYQQTQELREMIQRGTGSYELPANADSSRMAATSMSMVVGSMIKRSRRTLANIERHLLSPLVKKSLWRYMQFSPEKFPMRDYKFRVKTAMGIMAREFEQGQLVSLLSTVPAESPAFWMLMKGIYTHSSIDEREQMIQFCDQMIQQSSQPQEEQPDPKVMVDMARLQFEQSKWMDQRDLEARKLMQQDEMYRAEAQRDVGEGRMQSSTAILQLVKAETEQLRAQSEAVLALAKAEAERNKAEIEAYKAALEELKIRVTASKETSSPATSSSDSSESTAKPTGSVSLPSEVEPVDLDSEAEDRYSPVLEKMLALLEEQHSFMKGKDNVKDAEVRAFGQSGNDETILRLEQAVRQISDKLEQMAGQQNQATPSQEGIESGIEGQPGVDIQRDENGLVVAVNGRPVRRDENGLIAGID